MQSSDTNVVQLTYDDWQGNSQVLDFEDGLYVLSMQDGMAGLSLDDVIIAEDNEMTIPEIRGFTQKAYGSSPIVYLSAAEKYAKWKGIYKDVWNKFSTLTMTPDEQKHLYEILYQADKHGVPQAELMEVTGTQRYADLSVADKLATLRTYVIFKEAQNLNNSLDKCELMIGRPRSELFITPDFTDFIDKILTYLRNGELFVIDQKGQDTCGNVYAGRSNGLNYFEISDPVKNDPMFMKYVTIHEAYHYYARFNGKPNSETDVHRRSMNYFVLLTNGEGFYDPIKREQKNGLFNYKTTSGTSTSNEATEDAPMDFIRRNLEHMYRPNKNSYITYYNRFIDMVQYFKDADLRYYQVITRDEFWKLLYEAGLMDITIGYGVYDNYRDDITRLHDFIEIRIKKNLLNIIGDLSVTYGYLGNFVVTFVNGNPETVKLWERYKESHHPSWIRDSETFGELMDNYKANLYLGVPNSVKDWEQKGEGVYVSKDGKWFSPSYLIDYYVLQLAMKKPNEIDPNLRSTIVEAFGKYPVR